MVDITITDREVNSFLVNIGLTFLFGAAALSIFSVYTLLWGDRLEGDSIEAITLFIGMFSMIILSCLSIGLLFLHWPKALEYEEKED